MAIKNTHTHTLDPRGLHSVASCDSHISKEIPFEQQGMRDLLDDLKSLHNEPEGDDKTKGEAMMSGRKN